jgi:hypothetical protein
MKNLNNNFVLSVCSISSCDEGGGGVYSINIPGQHKCYVGKTKNFKKRWANHLRQLKKNNHHCVELQNAYNFSLDKNTIVFEMLYIGKPTSKMEREFMNKIGANNLLNSKIKNIRKNGDNSKICSNKVSDRISDRNFATNLRRKLEENFKEFDDYF